MNESFSHFHESNPFSTRFTAPGKLPFFFERSFALYIKSSRPAKFQEFFSLALGMGEDIRTSVCLQYLVDKFQSHSCRGQIIGAHGSGKTTLMLALKERLLREGFEIFSWSLHDQSSFLPDVFWYEMQQFLQSVPVFLPTKCLLPPPVISREEYVAQQRSAYQDFFGDGDVEEGTTPGDEDLGFSVHNSAESETDDERLSSSNDSGATSSHNHKWDTKLLHSKVPGLKDGESVKFAPFPGVSDYDPTPLNSDDAVEETFDSIELEPNEPADDLIDASKIDLQKNRSLFEKKALFFDGFEQLSFVNRVIIRTFCRMNRLGLLITTHSPALGLPVLFRAAPSVETLNALLKFLLDDVDGWDVTDSELETLLKNFHFNVREILFSLYDAYENYRLAPRGLRDRIVRRYPR